MVGIHLHNTTIHLIPFALRNKAFFCIFLNFFQNRPYQAQRQKKNTNHFPQNPGKKPVNPKHKRRQPEEINAPADDRTKEQIPAQITAGKAQAVSEKQQQAQRPKQQIQAPGHQRPAPPPHQAQRIIHAADQCAQQQRAEQRKALRQRVYAHQRREKKPRFCGVSS